MTAVRIQGNPKKGESVDNMKKAHPDAIVVIDSMALFKGDKLVGFLSVEDTRNYLWTQNQIENTSISVPCGKNRFAALRITDSKTKLKGRIKNGKPKIEVDIVMEGSIYGSTCKGHMDDPETYKKIRRINESICKRKSILKRSKRFKMIMEWIFLDLEKLFTVKIINNLRKSKIIGMKPLKTLK